MTVSYPSPGKELKPLLIQSLERKSLEFKCDCPVHAVNDDGWNALMIATAYNQPGIANFLINAGCEINQINQDGFSAISFSITDNQKELFYTFVKKGADLNIKTTNSATLLMLAIENNQIEIARFLLEKEVNLKDFDHEGWTPLMYAIYYGQNDLIDSLISISSIQDGNLDDSLSPLTMSCKYSDELTINKIIQSLNYTPTYKEVKLSIKYCKRNGLIKNKKHLLLALKELKTT